MYIKSCSNNSDNYAKYQTALKSWSIERTLILKQNDSLTALLKTHNFSIDSASKIIQQRDTVIKKLQINLNKVTKKNDSTMAVLQADSMCTPICHTALDLAASYKSELDSSQKQLALSQQNNSSLVYQNGILVTDKRLLVDQNDSLKHIIVTVPVYKQEKFLGFIPLPDRKTSFIAGAILGTVSTIIVKKHIK